MPVNTPHPDLVPMLHTYCAIRDVLAGEAAVKKATTKYLPRLPGQKIVLVDGQIIDLYANYLLRAVLLPFAGPLVARLLGMVFRHAPVFTVPDVVTPDLENLPLTAPAQIAESFAKAVTRENLTLGRGAIVVDYDERLGRPYQRFYGADAVISWAYTFIGAVPVLSRVVLKECVLEPDDEDPFAMEDEEQYRVLELTAMNGGAPILTHTLYREVETGGAESEQYVPIGPPLIPTRRGVPLTFIPVVPVTPFGCTFAVEKPPLQDLSDLILSHYRLSADYYNLLHQCGAGSVLFGAGFGQNEQQEVKQVGGGTLVFSENPAASMQYVQTDGQAGVEIERAMAKLEAQMGTAVGRLLMAQQKNVAESGAALELQFSGDDATLQQIAGSTAMALENAMRIHAWWAGTSAQPSDEVDVHVELNDQFVVTRMSAQDQLVLTNTEEMGGLTDRDLYFQLKRGEALDPETTFEQWQAEREAETPEPTDTGEAEAEAPEDDEAEEPSQGSLPTMEEE